MIKPYFETGLSEKGRPEISLHGLSLATARTLFHGLRALLDAELKEMARHQADYNRSRLLSQKEHAARCSTNANNLIALIDRLQPSYDALGLDKNNNQALTPIEAGADAPP